MKSFDTLIDAELNSETLKFFLLIDLEFSSTYRYTDCDIPLYYGGNKYTNIPMTMGNIVVSSDMGVDTVELKFSNVGLTFSSIVLGENISSKVVTLSFCCVGSDRRVIEKEQLFRGFVSSWKLDETEVEIVLSNEFIYWSKRTLRTCQASCRWNFKGTECGYSGGDTWCDKTFYRCQALLNTDNYGGFRFMPAIQEKNVWWGRSPEY